MKLTTTIALVMVLQTRFNPAQQPPGGAIEGIAVRVGTGEPIAGATVLVQPAAPLPPAPGGGAPQPPVMPPAVTTDAQGRFVAKDLDAGSYRLFFWAAGYVRQEFGQRGLVGLRPAAGTPVNVSVGQTVRDIRVALTNPSPQFPSSFSSPFITFLESEPSSRLEQRQPTIAESIVCSG
jgi:hypothetical protein